MAKRGLFFALFLAFSLLIGPLASQDRVTATAPTNPDAVPSFVLKLSQSPDRSNPIDLLGATVADKMYVFLAPDSGATQVRFFLDNPAASGTPLQTENNAPWDFAGGSSTAATPYDTTKLSNGQHSVTASISLSAGGVISVTSTFTVSNPTGFGATPAPTATVSAPTPTPVPPTATPQPTTYNNLISKSSNRSAAVGLQGQTVSGNIYVFVSPETGVTQVRFYLDNPSGTGTPLQTENGAPWDFAGGSSTAANPYDTTKLSNGTHSITASITLSSGAVVLSTATFSVNNSVAPTATKVPPTATKVPPTATAVPPTATKVPATATEQAQTYNNLFSKASNRSAATGLPGQTVSGNIYVFVSPESGVSQVRFYLDNPSGSGTPRQTENNAPWDFAGGSADAANAFDTTTMSNGAHSITASITLTSGAVVVSTANFTVNNAPASTPVPTALPTATPPVSAPSGSIYWGVNMQSVPYDMAKLSAWERDVAGKAVSIVHWGSFWGDSSGNYRSWSNSGPDNARGHGSIPMISWTPEGGDPGKWQLGDIINGSHDAYIRQFATDAKNWGKPFFLRIMHEMNGSWGYPWQETQNGNSRGQFVQAWRHIIDIFRSVGVSNASYVWCPNIDYPNTTNPSFASLYPGDSYVDWTCLDGYNWGTNRSSGWQSFDTVYSYSYNEVLKVAPSKPMMIGEFGSVEQGGSKASWLSDALKTQIPSRYPRIRAALYFNWQFDGVDWRIETSQSSIDAWKAGLSSSYYMANSFGAITGKPAVP